MCAKSPTPPGLPLSENIDKGERSLQNEARSTGGGGVISMSLIRCHVLAAWWTNGKGRSVDSDTIDTDVFVAQPMVDAVHTD